MLNQNMVREATRLTRAGQLVEATALLQRMLRGDATPAPTSTKAMPQRGRNCPTFRLPPLRSNRSLLTNSRHWR